MSQNAKLGQDVIYRLAAHARRGKLASQVEHASRIVQVRDGNVVDLIVEDENSEGERPYRVNSVPYSLERNSHTGAWRFQGESLEGAE